MLKLFLIITFLFIINSCNAQKDLQNYSKKSEVLKKNIIVIWQEMDKDDCNDFNINLMLNHLQLLQAQDGKDTFDNFLYYSQGNSKLECEDIGREKQVDCIADTADSISSGADSCIIGLDNVWWSL